MADLNTNITVESLVPRSTKPPTFELWNLGDRDVLRVMIGDKPIMITATESDLHALRDLLNARYPKE